MTNWVPSVGLAMLLVLGILTVITELPIWALLIGVASSFAVGGVLVGVMDFNVLAATPARIVGLLDSDLLQALPLYVFVGLLLQRLAVADALFVSIEKILSPLGGARSLAALSVGALVAPMNGSVASSSALMARLVAPRLKGMDAAKSTALVGVASTIGVIVPPSLVLILLGDAMMRAHIEASSLPGFMLGQQRIINTQDVFHAALLPGVALLVLWALVARWQSRGFDTQTTRVANRSAAIAVTVAVGMVALLAGVFNGKLFAVEAAAAACMALVLAALGSRGIDWSGWKALLAAALSLSGALMAMLIGATVFSMVFRLWGTDRWLTAILLSSSLAPSLTALAVLMLVAACAWVLDAFEMIFVVIPFVAPPMIALLGDAQQAAVLLLLVLQLSFLLPPMGYAVMMARAQCAQALSLRALVYALAPFIGMQCLVLACVFVVPAIVHLLDAKQEDTAVDPVQDLDTLMRKMADEPSSFESK